VDATDETDQSTATPPPPPPDEFALLSAPGDTLLVLGSPWSHPDYAGLIRAQRARGLRVALLVYDLIPIRRPEWCDRGLVRLFCSWYDSVFPLCDVLFAISRSTAHDVELYARSHRIELPGRVIPIPIGTGFGKGRASLGPARKQNLPPPGTYALIVSTIEARKNHVLLFRIWRRLLEELPPERVPTLVFAGRIGWLVDDLMRQIANTNYLNGKLVLVENPPDDELTSLYRGCLFTLFPSLYEGWGLPVTESLALGKPCFISNRTSLPEAGGSLARAFDPDNMNEAYDMIRAVIEDRVDLGLWEARVQREFRPVSWSASADAILCGIGTKVAQEEPMAAD
jgi:glycosyltransferase involved in cell wall biosynthesis